MLVTVKVACVIMRCVVMSRMVMPLRFVCNVAVCFLFHEWDGQVVRFSVVMTRISLHVGSIGIFICFFVSVRTSVVVFLCVSTTVGIFTGAGANLGFYIGLDFGGVNTVRFTGGEGEGKNLLWVLGINSSDELHHQAFLLIIGCEEWLYGEAKSKKILYSNRQDGGGSGISRRIQWE